MLLKTAWSTLALLLYKRQSQWAVPTSLGVCLTDRCNIKCTYCMRETFKPPSGELDLDDIQVMLRNAPTVTGVCIMGLCEPYCNPNTSRIIKWLKDEGHYSISFTTNCTIPFTPVKLDALRRVDDMAVSIDSADPVVFRELRGTSLDTVMTHLTDIIRYKRVLKLTATDSPPIHINAVITQRNWSGIPDLIKMFEPYANDLTYLMLDPCTRPDYSKADVFTSTEKPSNFDDFKHLAKLSPLKVIGFDYMFQPSSEWSTCSMSWLGPFVQPNGDVYPCYGYRTVVGNIYRESLLHAWNSPLIREFRRSLQTPYPPLVQCRFCNFARPKWQVGGAYNKLHEDQDK
ncbi:MAG: radical SAM protein [Candidatus Paceibacterota bacterium]